jgi:hypothetical protein
VKVKVTPGRLVEVQATADHGVERRAFGEFVSPRGELASYAFGWVSDDGGAGRITIGIGRGNPGGGSFHAVVFPHEGSHGFALVDEPFEEVPQGGPHLTADQARAHEDLPFVWAVVDTVMERDPRARWMLHSVVGTSAIVTDEVADGREPALLVTHDADDGMWQLVGATGARPGTGRIQHLHALDADPSLLEVLDLAPGEAATRRRVGGRWKRRSSRAL